ncbi:MAG: RNA degradosome polyphosphate kinase, partial [Xanthomonadaceae bacterium]|nr:RNA degradosome polyphosphate kinase [Xanthomonadaceae bacterium]
VLYLSSADMMERNLDRRVECAFPVENRKLQQRIHAALELYLDDNSGAADLQPDGSYRPATRAAGEAVRDAQAQLLEKLCGVPA